METIIKDKDGYFYKGLVIDTLQEAEDLKYIIEKFEDYKQKRQKSKLTINIYKSLNLLKAFRITDREFIYKTIKENEENLWSIFR